MYEYVEKWKEKKEIEIEKEIRWEKGRTEKPKGKKINELRKAKKC